MQKIGVNVP